MIPALVFYMFAFVLLASAVMVITARNPVHAVLFMVLCFFNAAGLFLLMGAEFIAFILAIVYVGAVAVLFLFVVMMLDIDFQKLRQGMRRYLLIGSTVGVILFIQLSTAVWVWSSSPKAIDAVDAAANVDNTRALGKLIYTTYFFPFQVSGLILLVAMIGAITLTLRDRGDTRKQSVPKQLARRVDETIAVCKVPSGQGMDI